VKAVVVHIAPDRGEIYTKCCAKPLYRIPAHHKLTRIPEHCTCTNGAKRPATAGRKETRS